MFPVPTVLFSVSRQLVDEEADCVHRPAPLPTEDLRTHRFWCPGRSWDQPPPRISRDSLRFGEVKNYTQFFYCVGGALAPLTLHIFGSSFLFSLSSLPRSSPRTSPKLSPFKTPQNEGPCLRPPSQEHTLTFPFPH